MVEDTKFSTAEVGGATNNSSYANKFSGAEEWYHSWLKKFLATRVPTKEKEHWEN